MSGKIYLSSPHMSDEGYEMQYIREAFESNWIAPLGANVDGFEKEFAEKVGSKSAAALVTGTSAIHMALRALRVTKGDIVFCQSLTFAATANPIIYEKAIPVFIDSDEGTWNMDPEALEEAFKRYPSVKAVIVVHLYGLSAEIGSILDICNKHDVPLIEDAAEALGAYYKGKHVGTFGELGVFSFNGNKIITTSGGGMLVSDNKELVEKARFWSCQSRDRERHYQHSELGYNYRMSNVLAGIGRGQLRILDDRVRRKREIFEYYKENLKDVDGIGFMPINEWNEPNCWLSCMTLDERKTKIKPIDVMKVLEEENIESRHIWKPMHIQPYFNGCDYVGGNVSEKLFRTGVCLPSDTKMGEEELERVIGLMRKLFN